MSRKYHKESRRQLHNSIGQSRIADVNTVSHSHTLQYVHAHCCSMPCTTNQLCWCSARATFQRGTCVYVQDASCAREHVDCVRTDTSCAIRETILRARRAHGKDTFAASVVLIGSVPHQSVHNEREYCQWRIQTMVSGGIDGTTTICSVLTYSFELRKCRAKWLVFEPFYGSLKN